jgi:uncharacterized protein (DUF1778 family)
MNSTEIRLAPTLTLGARFIVPKKKAKVKKTEDKTWTLRPDDEIRELVTMALNATGGARQELIFRAIRENLDAVVRQVINERQKAADAWINRTGKRPGEDTGKPE